MRKCWFFSFHTSRAGLPTSAPIEPYLQCCLCKWRSALLSAITVEEQWQLSFTHYFKASSPSCHRQWGGHICPFPTPPHGRWAVGLHLPHSHSVSSTTISSSQLYCAARCGVGMALLSGSWWAAGSTSPLLQVACGEGEASSPLIPELGNSACGTREEEVAIAEVSTWFSQWVAWDGVG